MEVKRHIYESPIGNIAIEMEGGVLVSASFCDGLADVSCEEEYIDGVNVGTGSRDSGWQESCCDNSGSITN